MMTSWTGVVGYL